MRHPLRLFPVLALLLCACGSDGDTTAPLPPALVATIPAAPSFDSTPALRGNAEPGASVLVYEDTACAGPAVGFGSADAAGSLYAAVVRPVVGGVALALSATATDAAGNVSGCSAPLGYRSVIRPTGFFQAGGSPIAVGDAPWSLAVGDLNGDSRPDLVVANRGSGNVSVLLGDGIGGFTEAPGSPIDIGGIPHSVAIGDLDRDGRLDLAVANRPGGVSVLLGDGSGGFTEPAGSPVTAGTEPWSLAVGDLNRDDRLDLAVANRLSYDVSVLLGDGSGGFTEAAGSPISAPIEPESVAVGDLNRDGRLDLAVAKFDSDDVSVLLGDGSGGFAEAPGSPIATGSSAVSGPRSVAIGDLNRDDRLDLAVANFHIHEVSVLLGDGTGGFAEAPGSPIATRIHPRSVAIDDLNGDGRLDLAVASEFSDNVSVLLGDGSGGFTESAGSPIAAGDGPRSLAVGDLNGDGLPDLAVANQFSDDISVLLGR